MNKIIITLLLITIYSCNSNPESQESKEEPKKEVIEESKTSSVWKERPMVDKFGDETDKTTLVALFKGKFTNSATNDGDLKIQVNVSDSSVYISLLEYGTHPVNFESGQESISIKTKEGVKDIEVFCYQQFITDVENNLFSYLVATEEPIKFYFEYDRSTYSFEIDTRGLKEKLIN